MRTLRRSTIHRIAGLYATAAIGPLVWRSWLILFTVYALSKVIDYALNSIAPGFTDRETRPPRQGESAKWRRFERRVDAALILAATSAAALASIRFDIYSGLVALNIRPITDAPPTLVFGPIIVAALATHLYLYPRQLARYHGWV